MACEDYCHPGLSSSSWHTSTKARQTAKQHLHSLQQATSKQTPVRKGFPICLGFDHTGLTTHTAGRTLCITEKGVPDLQLGTGADHVVVAV